MSCVFCGTFSIPSFAIFQYVLFFLTHSFLIKATCYFPDGTPTEDIPCTTNSSVKADYCCGKDSICFENKICLNNIGTLARGSCTDKSWNSPACPFFCVSGKSSLEVLHTFRLMTLRKHRPFKRWRPDDRVPAAVFRNLVL